MKSPETTVCVCVCVCGVCVCGVCVCVCVCVCEVAQSCPIILQITTRAQKNPSIQVRSMEKLGNEGPGRPQSG